MKGQGKIAPMSKYTPGPWTANLHHTQVRGGRSHGFIHAKQLVPIAAVVLAAEGCDEAEGRANTYLIAAVPDLLEALQAVVAIVDRKTVEFDRACAAIAKATQP